MAGELDAFLYGTGGTCPAFSCASRAALSVASCAAVSFGTNVPRAVPGVGVGLAAVVAAEAVSVVAPSRPCEEAVRSPSVRLREAGGGWCSSS